MPVRPSGVGRRNDIAAGQDEILQRAGQQTTAQGRCAPDLHEQLPQGLTPIARLRLFLNAAAAALVLSACAAAAETSGRIQARYTCEDGTALSVRFSADGDTATVEQADQQALVLPRQRAADGFLYETPAHTLRGKGDEAMWTVGRRGPVRCRVSS
jgi:membrane-bound inhibitor of C-type lysozyme